MHAYIFEDCPFSVVLCKIGRYSATSFYRPALVLSQGAPFEQYCRILGYLATVLSFPPVKVLYYTLGIIDSRKDIYEYQHYTSTRIPVHLQSYKYIYITEVTDGNNTLVGKA